MTTTVVPQATITVDTKEGRKTIEAIAIEDTPFAYHLTLWKNPTGGEPIQSQCYSVTHIPTGLQLPFFFDSASHCERYVTALIQYKQRWQRPDYTDLMKRLCKQTWEVVR